MILLLFFGTATVVMILAAAVHPAYWYLYVLCVVIGLGGTERAYRRMGVRH